MIYIERSLKKSVKLSTEVIRTKEVCDHGKALLGPFSIKLPPYSGTSRKCPVLGGRWHFFLRKDTLYLVQTAKTTHDQALLWK